MHICVIWKKKNWYRSYLQRRNRDTEVESKHMNSKGKVGDELGNWDWYIYTIDIFVRRTDAETETPVFWSSDENSWLIGKVPDAGKDWGQKEKRVSEDEMGGWHHQCNGHELGQTLGDGEGQGGLVCCSPWSCKELDMTGQLKRRRQWLPTPVLLPGKSQGRRSLVDCSPWGR